MKNLPFETDGPPRAFFEVMEDLVDIYGERHVIRLMYRTIGVVGQTEDAVRKWMDGALAEIRTWCIDEGAFIFWRMRPSFNNGYPPAGTNEEEIEDGLTPPPAEIWRGYARLITSIPMPEEIWVKYQVKEGERYRQI